MGAISLTVALLGVTVAHWFYVRNPELPVSLARRLTGVYRTLLNKYWVDEIYQAVFVDFGKRLCGFLWGVDSRVVDGAVNGSSWVTVRLSFLSAWNDLKIVDGLVNAVAEVIQGGGSRLRRLQTGVVQNYILAMSLGILGMVILYLFFLR
jgi:NADH-quinone oxidoreductase subunit L